MKNFTLLFISLFAFSVTNAQNSTTRTRGLVSIPDSTDFWASYSSGPYNYTGKDVDYTYDANNNVTSYINETLINGWANSYKYEFTYDNNNNEASGVTQSWTGGAWVNATKFSHSYNSYNNITAGSNETWNTTTNRWDTISKLFIDYNSYNKDSLLLQQDSSKGSFVNSGQIIYTYNTDSNLTNEVSQDWNNNAWNNVQQQIFTYNGNNQLTDLYQNWTNNAWLNNILYTSAYNSNNLPVYKTTSYWLNNAWSTESADSFTYNPQKSVTGDKLFTWANSVRQDYAQFVYAYNTNNQETLLLFQLLQNNAWTNSYQYVNSYSDTSYYSKNQTWSGSAWVNSMAYSYRYNSNDNSEASYTTYVWDPTGATIISSDSTHYYYLTVTEGVNPINEISGLKIYPNPAGNLINTSVMLKQNENLKLQLINVFGQIVWSDDEGITNHFDGTISVADLPVGIYLLQITAGVNITSQKVMITH